MSKTSCGKKFTFDQYLDVRNWTLIIQHLNALLNNSRTLHGFKRTGENHRKQKFCHSKSLRNVRIKVQGDYDSLSHRYGSHWGLMMMCLWQIFENQFGALISSALAEPPTTTKFSLWRDHNRISPTQRVALEYYRNLIKTRLQFVCGWRRRAVILRNVSIKIQYDQNWVRLWDIFGVIEDINFVTDRF